MTCPLCAARPQASPRASVSAGLREMFVSMNRERTQPVFVSDSHSLSRNDFSYAAKPDKGKALFPGIHKGNRLTAANRKQELEILTIGQGGQESRFGAV